MSDLIDQDTKNNIREFIECDFSTTDQTSRTVSKITLMSIMKKYFGYGFQLLCGLPKVRLGGTLKDWIKIRERASHFLEYDVDGTMAKWMPMLHNVLDRFIETYQQASAGGVSDELKSFWNSIVHHSGGGSGPSYLSGWILTFIPFNNRGRFILGDKPSNGQYRIDTDDIPNGFCETPVEIDDNGKIYNCNFYSGQFMAEYRDGYVRPSIDWIMVNVI
jgi:hypothetical protein